MIYNTLISHQIFASPEYTKYILLLMTDTYKK